MNTHTDTQDRQTGALDGETDRYADIYQITDRTAVPGITLDLTQLHKN